MTRWGMVIDLAKCIGCDACTVACKVENLSPGKIFYAPVHQAEVGRYPSVKRVFIPLLCMHCEDPPCMKACPSKAIYKRPDGVVLVDENKCCGARACVSACPYGAMHFFDSGNETVFGVETVFDILASQKHKHMAAQKCSFCAHRIDSGLDKGLKPGVDRDATPACVITCPAECRIFGDLHDGESPSSKYLKKAEEMGRIVFRLRPDAGTGPSVIYVK
ncbi:MAG: 4Fe-4S dicluster domain-containing protein [Candidatus Caldarchaeum sp.]